MILKGKNCIITGASSGIVEAISLAFASKGANVAVCYKQNESGSDFVCDKIKSIGRKTLKIQADLAEESEIEKVALLACEYFSVIHVLVNCAGILDVSALDDLTQKKMQDLFNINLFAPLLLTKHISSHMKDNKIGGSIINISSTSFLKPSVGLCPYECSKAGVSTLTKGLALELSPYKIRVNCIIPGLTITNMTNQFIEASDIGKFPLGRIGNTTDYAGPAIFLASEQSNWITGTSIVVDGGFSIK